MIRLWPKAKGYKAQGDTLNSKAYASIVDLISQGEIKGVKSASVVFTADYKLTRDENNKLHWQFTTHVNNTFKAGETIDVSFLNAPGSENHPLFTGTRTLEIASLDETSPNSVFNCEEELTFSGELTLSDEVTGSCEIVDDAWKKNYYLNDNPLQNILGIPSLSEVYCSKTDGSGDAANEVVGYDMTSATKTTEGVNLKVENADPNNGQSKQIADQGVNSAGESLNPTHVAVVIGTPRLEYIKDGKPRALELNYTLHVIGTGDDSSSDGLILTQNNFGFNGAQRTNDLYQQELVIDVRKKTFPITITVKRLTGNYAAEGNNPKIGDLYFYSITKIYTQTAVKYKDYALVGSRLDSEYLQSIPKRSWLVQGIKTYIPDNCTVSDEGRLVYDGTAWTGRFNLVRQWHRCPVWAMYDLLTHRRYGLGDQLLTSDERKNFAAGTWFGQASNIDKYSFYSASVYSNEFIHTPIEKGDDITYKLTSGNSFIDRFVQFVCFRLGNKLYFQPRTAVDSTDNPNNPSPSDFELENAPSSGSHVFVDVDDQCYNFREKRENFVRNSSGELTPPSPGGYKVVDLPADKDNTEALFAVEIEEGQKQELIKGTWTVINGIIIIQDSSWKGVDTDDSRYANKSRPLVPVFKGNVKDNGIINFVHYGGWPSINDDDKSSTTYYESSRHGPSQNIFLRFTAANSNNQVGQISTKFKQYMLERRFYWDKGLSSGGNGWYQWGKNGQQSVHNIDFALPYQTHKQWEDYRSQYNHGSFNWAVAIRGASTFGLSDGDTGDVYYAPGFLIKDDETPLPAGLSTDAGYTQTSKKTGIFKLTKSDPRFQIGVNINKRLDAFKMINQMASVFRGIPYWSAGGLSLMQDRPTPSSYLFNTSNVVQGLFKYASTAQNKRTTVAVVKYFDNDLRDWAYEEVKDNEVKDANGKSNYEKRGAIKNEIVAFGCTSRTQANRLARYIIYTNSFETEVVTFNAGPEAGAVLRPGMVIDIADPLKAGFRRGGRVVSATTNTIVVDDSSETDLPANSVSASCVRTLHVMGLDGRLITKTITDITGTTVTISGTFDPAVEPNSVWIIETTLGTSAENIQTTQWRVYGIEEDEENNTFNVAAISYNSSKFNYIEHGKPLEFRDFSNLNELPKTPGQLFPLSTFSVAGEVITVTTKNDQDVAVAHGFTADDVNLRAVSLYTVDKSYSNSFVIASVPSTTTFTIANDNIIGSASLPNNTVAVSTLQVKEILYRKGTEVKAKMMVSWPNTMGVNEYRVEWRAEGKPWNIQRQQANTFELFDVVKTEDNTMPYEFRIYSLNAALVKSEFPLRGGKVGIGKSARPSTVTGFASTIDPENGVTLTWNKIVPSVANGFADLDVVGYEVRKGTSSPAENEWGTGGVNQIITADTDTVFLGFLDAGTHKYYLKAFDTVAPDLANDASQQGKNYSQTAVEVTVTIPTPSFVINDLETVYSVENDSKLVTWTPPTSLFGIDKYIIEESQVRPTGSNETYVYTSYMETPSPSLHMPYQHVGEKRFRIKFRDRSGTVSSNSFVVPSNVDVAPAIIADVSTTFDSIVLSWSEVNFRDPQMNQDIKPKAYIIKRRKKSDVTNSEAGLIAAYNDGELIATVNATSYIFKWTADLGLDEYVFIVRAIGATPTMLGALPTALPT